MRHRSRRHSRCRRRSPIAACAGTAFTGCRTSTSRRCWPPRSARGPRQNDRAAPRQRLEHVRDGFRRERGEHDGVHRRRRAADGHALRQSRPGCAPLPDGRARNGRPRARKADLSGVGAAGAFGNLQRHAHAGGKRRAGGEMRRSTSSSTGSVASWARSPPRSAGSTRSSSPPASARTAAACASACAATRHGSASRSTPPPMRPVVRASAPPAAALPPG